MTSDTRTLIHTIRAKSEGERIAHQRTRFAFLRHLIVDTRTRNLFARWAFTLGIDEAIDAPSRPWIRCVACGPPGPLVADAADG